MKNHIRTIILVFALGCIFLLRSEGPALAKEVKIAFTGQSYSTLYPCQCPQEPDGGVARRAAVFKRLRSESPDIVLVEAGASFASGQYDQHTQNYEADIRRTEVYLKALGLMKYDALLVSSQEYVFGSEFLSRYAELPFVSSNMEGYHRPHAIKDLGWIKIGILGLTDEFVTTKGITGWQASSILLAKRVTELKKSGADVIVLLSSLSQQEDMNLTAGVKGIDIVINGGNSYGSVNLVEKEDGTAHVTTWWQSRKIGVLTLEISGKKIINKRLEAIRLGPDITDDPDVGPIVPQCFSNMDCNRKPAHVAKCENPGRQEAACAYIKPGMVNLAVISPRLCRTCRIDEVLKSLQGGLGEISVRRIFEDEPEAKAIIKEFGIKMLPAYLFNKDFERSEYFLSLKQMLEPGSEFYLMKPENSGVSYILGRARTPKTLDVFFGFDSATSSELFSLLKAFSQKHKDADVRVNLLAIPDGDNAGKFLARGGDAIELEELRNIACIDAIYPKKTIDYLICRFKQRDRRDLCLAELKINASKINSCVVSPQGQEAMANRTKLTQELQIASGPTFVIDNSEIFSIINIPPLDQFERVVFGAGEKEKIE